MILITTSDYPPKLGGLSTFTINIQCVLDRLKIDYEVFHWNSKSDIDQFDFNKINKYELVINIHSMFCWLAPHGHEKMINFIHGSEILMTSPNYLFRLFKYFNREKYLKKMENSKLNIFISQATVLKIKEMGYRYDYSRDLIFHNCIDTSGAEFVQLNMSESDEIVLTCIARNVPHKNLAGSVCLAEFMSDFLQKPVRLILAKNSHQHSSKITIEELTSVDNVERNNAYRRSHFNLLLSLDHSSKGFFEGFGLTVLEAACFGVPSIVLNSGGLPEAVHHNETGYVFSTISQVEIQNYISLKSENAYQAMRRKAFTHVNESHSLLEYEHFFHRLFINKDIAC